jgi:hypothetical protein
VICTGMITRFYPTRLAVDDDSSLKIAVCLRFQSKTVNFTALELLAETFGDCHRAAMRAAFAAVSPRKPRFGGRGPKRVIASNSPLI